MSLRLAVVTDIHHGPPSAAKRGDAAMDGMAAFARFVAEARADLVLDLGDRITDVDAATDRQNLADVAESFRAVPAPVWHLNGNHDLDHLDPAENAAALGQEMGHALHDAGGWRIVLWRADARIRRDGSPGFVLDERDLVWLAAAMQAADRPCLVVSHVPLSGHAQTGNYYFENNPAFATYPGAARIRAALALARVPVVCLAGHVHWNTITCVDGITHLTQQSLTESFTTGGEPAMAMGLVELGEAVRWEVAGADPIAFAFRPDTRRWTPPLPDFRSHAGLRHAPPARAAE